MTPSSQWEVWAARQRVSAGCLTHNLTDERRRRWMAAPDGKLVREALKEGIQHNKHS